MLGRRQAALKDLFQTFPNSPICNLPPGPVGPVIARFDQMRGRTRRFWGVVLPLNTLDMNEIKAFFAQQGERTNPEPLCAAPTATPGPSGSPAASTSPTGSAAPTNTAAPTAAPTTVPTATPAPAAS